MTAADETTRVSDADIATVREEAIRLIKYINAHPNDTSLAWQDVRNGLAHAMLRVCDAAALASAPQGEAVAWLVMDERGACQPNMWPTEAEAKRVAESCTATNLKSWKPVKVYLAHPPRAVGRDDAASEDAERIDWLESVLHPGTPAIEIYLAGLRHHNTADATSYQVEGSSADPENPAPFAAYQAPSLRAAIDAARAALTPTPEAT